MWYLPAMKQWMQRWNTQRAEYNACEYGSPYFKPQWFVGVLTALSSMSRKCTHGWQAHPPCIGSRTGPAAEYTPELCDAYATLVLDAWMRVAAVEWDTIMKLGRTKCCGEDFLVPGSDFCHKCGKTQNVLEGQPYGTTEPGLLYGLAH